MNTENTSSSGDRWYYVFSGARQGPVDETVLAERIAVGQVRADTLVWREGMGEWAAAASVERWRAEFDAAAAAGMGAVPPVAPGPIVKPRAVFVPGGYAGFWVRLVAYVVDSILLSVGYVLLVMVLMVPMGLVGAGSSGNPSSAAGTGMLLVLGCASYVLPVMMFWAYFALMESSRHQGTLGKMVMGLRVMTEDGQRLSLGRATARFLGRMLSGMILCIGYIMVAFTEKKQGLHDLIAGTIVVTRRG